MKTTITRFPLELKYEHDAGLMQCNQTTFGLYRTTLQAAPHVFFIATKNIERFITCSDYCWYAAKSLFNKTTVN